MKILNYTDKMSMLEGMDVRVPFLDPELIELAVLFSHARYRNKTKFVI